MAICPACEGDKTENISCLLSPMEIGGDLFEPIRWGDERDGMKPVVDFPCPDCGTPPGGAHHPGCCVQRCPACLGETMRCPCFAPSDEDLSRGRLRTYCRAHLLPRHYRH